AVRVEEAPLRRRLRPRLAELNLLLADPRVAIGQTIEPVAVGHLELDVAPPRRVAVPRADPRRLVGTLRALDVGDDHADVMQLRERAAHGSPSPRRFQLSMCARI